MAGSAGETYQYIGPDGAAIDLGKEDYSNTLKWQSVNLGNERRVQLHPGS